jgi:putative tryptophan/tyrosine transport system permease protein
VLLLGIIASGVIFGLYVWFQTRVGVKMRAASIGGTFAKNANLDRSGWLIAGLALTNAFCGLGGALLSMRQGFADISMNQGILILSLAALSLGERLLPPRNLDAVSFVLLSAITGSIIYQVIVVYTIRAGVNTSDIKLITAALVLGAIWLKRADQRLLTSEE